MITPSFSLTATERARPKLALDFTSASLDSRITFTRTTGASNPATYVNSSGAIKAATNNEPRFDYDPVALVCKGLLIEESRTNLVAYSNNFAQNPWSKSAGATLSASSNLSPDGINNAIQVAFAASGDFVSYPVTNYNAVIGQSVTISLYVRSANRAIQFGGASTSGTDVYTSINAGNGWYRQVLTRTFTVTTATGVVQLLVFGGQAAGLGPYSIWGGQIEAGAFATSYIPTNGTALTRNADVATMTGANFSDWFNTTQGTFRVDGITPASGARALISADDNTSGNSIVMSTVGTAPKLTVTQSSTEQANVSAGTITANTAMFVYASYASNYFGIARPSARQVDNSGTVPTVDRLRIGTDQTGNYVNGIIQAIQFWP